MKKLHKIVKKHRDRLQGLHVMIALLVAAVIISIVNAAQVEINNNILTVFSGINNNYSSLHFIYGGNQFGGVVLWRDNITLSSPQTVTVNSQTVTNCTEQIRGIYYSNPRGNRLRPLDQNTLTGLQSLDSSYNGVSLTGGLYTNCTGTGAQSTEHIYGALGHIRGGHTYRIVAGTSYQFATNGIGTSFSGTTSKSGTYDGTGRIFDSQGGIALIAASFGSNTVVGYCGDGTVQTPNSNAQNEQCDDGSNNGVACTPGGSSCNYCTNSCTIATVQASVTPSRGGGAKTLQEDFCPDGDYSASYYDGECGTKSHMSAAETLEKYAIIHGDYNKGPEDPERYQLNRFLKRGEVRKIMVRTITDQKFEEPYAGATRATRYQYDLENKIGITYGSDNSHEAMVTYLDAVNLILHSLKYQGRISSDFQLTWFPGSGRIIKRGQMMAAIVRFILPGALNSVVQNSTSSDNK